jgi:hypothetical protein
MIRALALARAEQIRKHDDAPLPARRVAGSLTLEVA